MRTPLRSGAGSIDATHKILSACLADPFPLSSPPLLSPISPFSINFRPRGRATVCMYTHTSNLDAFILQGHCPILFKWVGKKVLFFIPLFGWLMWAYGNISLDRSNLALAKKSLASVRFVVICCLCCLLYARCYWLFVVFVVCALFLCALLFVCCCCCCLV